MRAGHIGRFCRASAAALSLLSPPFAGVAQTAAPQAAAPAPVPSNAAARGVKVLEATETEPDTDQTPVSMSGVGTPRPGEQPAAPIATAAPADNAAAAIRPIAAPVIRSCPRPFAAADLTLSSADGFDKALAGKLRGHRRVVVDLATPYPQDDPAPAPLGTWLAEVSAASGKVTLAPYCSGARGAFGDWVAALFKRDPRRVYRPVRGFDVVLHADSVDRAVTQVEFVPRGTAASS